MDKRARNREIFEKFHAIIVCHAGNIISNRPFLALCLGSLHIEFRHCFHMLEEIFEEELHDEAGTLTHGFGKPESPPCWRSVSNRSMRPVSILWT